VSPGASASVMLVTGAGGLGTARLRTLAIQDAARDRIHLQLCLFSPGCRGCCSLLAALIRRLHTERCGRSGSAQYRPAVVQGHIEPLGSSLTAPSATSSARRPALGRGPAW
jgi:hypothetical protein